MPPRSRRNALAKCPPRRLQSAVGRGDGDSLFRVVIKKRMEADKARHELDEALKELVDLESQVMQVRDSPRATPRCAAPMLPAARSEQPQCRHLTATLQVCEPLQLERDNAVIREQLRPDADAAALPAAVANGSTLGPVQSTGTLLKAIYATPQIGRLTRELEAIEAETASIAASGEVYSNMKARLDHEVLDCRRAVRTLQDAVRDERSRNAEATRRESEVGRHLSAARARLDQLRKDAAAQVDHWQTEISERKTSVLKKRDRARALEGGVHAPLSPPPAGSRSHWRLPSGTMSVLLEDTNADHSNEHVEAAATEVST